MCVRLVLCALLLSSCGEDDLLSPSDPHRPFEDDATTVIGVDEAVVSGQTEDGCLQLDETCFPIDREGRYCKGNEGPVDVVVVDGEAVATVCYQDTDSTEGPTKVIDADGDGDLDVPQTDNGAVIVFDESTDGVPITGDVTISANDVTLYGNGPDKSIIDGNVTITGNNARIRGLRILGNLTIELNTAAVLFCVVEGNLFVRFNESLVAETDVIGSVTVTANQVILVGNDVGGDWNIDGADNDCQDNFAFDDLDGNKTASEGERNDLLTCAP